MIAQPDGLQSRFLYIFEKVTQWTTLIIRLENGL